MIVYFTFSIDKPVFGDRDAPPSPAASPPLESGPKTLPLSPKADMNAADRRSTTPANNNKSRSASRSKSRSRSLDERGVDKKESVQSKRHYRRGGDSRSKSRSRSRSRSRSSSRGGRRRGRRDRRPRTKSRSRSSSRSSPRRRKDSVSSYKLV